MIIDHCAQILSSGWLLWWMISAASERFLCLQLLPTPFPDTPILGKTQSTNTSSKTTTSTIDDTHTQTHNNQKYHVDSLHRFGREIMHTLPSLSHLWPPLQCFWLHFCFQRTSLEWRVSGLFISGGAFWHVVIIGLWSRHGQICFYYCQSFSFHTSFGPLKKIVQSFEFWTIPNWPR